ARPGGRVVIADDKIIRYAQDCRKDYGFALRAFEIVSLSRTNYEEIELHDSPIVKATGKGWNANRMHHLDPHLLPDNSWLASTDGYVRKIQIGLKY
ncbi:MAG: hypothetical protein GY865_17545, partial [candidate division Zixibacteria bacterium]|nr:hypothetical protein [candidate division Zixibacteria bacterium]